VHEFLSACNVNTWFLYCQLVKRLKLASVQLSCGHTHYRKYFVRCCFSQGMRISARSQANIVFRPILRQNRKDICIKLS
jgi:hypothetical protein